MLGIKNEGGLKKEERAFEAVVLIAERDASSDLPLLGRERRTRALAKKSRASAQYNIE